MKNSDFISLFFANLHYMYETLELHQCTWQSRWAINRTATSSHEFCLLGFQAELKVGDKLQDYPDYYRSAIVICKLQPLDLSHHLSDLFLAILCVSLPFDIMYLSSLTPNCSQSFMVVPTLVALTSTYTTTSLTCPLRRKL